MISKLSGTIVKKEINFVILDVGGIGFEINISPGTLESTKEEDEVNIWTQLIVRENSMELYGFEKEEELNFFKLLTGVSGVGPKSALAILGLEEVRTLKSAISEGDPSYLTKVSGIGKKSAERITLELKDKLGPQTETQEQGDIHKEDTDVLEALHSLGYSKQQAREAVKKLSPESQGVNNRLKEALKMIREQEVS